MNREEQVTLAGSVLAAIEQMPFPSGLTNSNAMAYAIKLQSLLDGAARLKLSLQEDDSNDSNGIPGQEEEAKET